MQLGADLNVCFGSFSACRNSITRPAGYRRKRSFKDGLTEQMNFFDECRLSPISRPSTVREIVSAIGSNRPIADIRDKRP